MGKGGRGTSSSPFPQGELWGKGKPAGELVGELYIGEGEGGTLGEKQLSVGDPQRGTIVVGGVVLTRGGVFF